MTSKSPLGSRGAGAEDVSLIVVNYNGAKHLRACIAGLLDPADAPLEVLVVDNGSTDDSMAVLDELRGRHPSLQVLRAGANLGYAGGVNFALPHARGAYVGVLNMDIVVDPGWLAPLVEFLEAHPEAGAVNPLILLAGGQRANAAGQNVHVSGLGFNRGLGVARDRFGHAPLRVAGIHGAAFLMRKDLLERLGGMDETGFLYHEDVNLSWLLRMSGYELFCVPQSTIRHEYFLSMFPAKFHLLERNRVALLLSFLDGKTLAAMAPVLAGTETLLWGYCLLKGGEFLRAKADSYLWVARHWSDIQKRRELAGLVRAVSDWKVLRELHWGYSWRQALQLLTDRTTPARHSDLKSSRNEPRSHTAVRLKDDDV